MMTTRARLNRSFAVDTQTDCWIWEKYIGPDGYGRINIGPQGAKGRTHSAHRVSYEVFVGPIPEGMWVLHRCDRRACINPEHLFLGTVRDNSADMVARGRSVCGTRNILAKLNEQAVKVILFTTERRIAGVCLLARLHNMGNPTVYKIAARKNWLCVAWPPPSTTEQTSEGKIP